MSTFYIADTHFHHKNICTYRTQFNGVEDMNETMIRYWNDVVGVDDIVYVVGDFAVATSATQERELVVPILKRLKGTKILIKGNHDRLITKELTDQFQSIHDYLEIEDGVDHVVLCHFPIAMHNRRRFGWIHVHGHTHDKNYDDPFKNAINVGVELPWMLYTPRTLQQLKPHISNMDVEIKPYTFWVSLRSLDWGTIFQVYDIKAGVVYTNMGPYDLENFKRCFRRWSNVPVHSRE